MRRAPLVLVAGVLASLLLPACGGASRALFAQRDFVSVYNDPEALAALRGAEPTLPSLWIESARLASVDGPALALARVREGLAFHPSEPTLLLSEVELLEVLGQHEEALQAGLRALALLPPQSVRIALLHSQLRNELALGRVDAAEAATRRLAGLIGVPESAEADAWARLALVLASHGHLERADACFDRSLSRGSNGLGTLLTLVAAEPTLAAASRTVRQRASERHPDDSDVALTLVVDLMQAGQPPEAEAALERLPSPLPPRLVPDVEALRARLALMQGRVEEGLERLAQRLDANPAERSALAVLQESWANLGHPSDREFARRLQAARPLVGPGERRNLDALLQVLAKRIAEAAAPLPETPSAQDGEQG